MNKTRNMKKKVKVYYLYAYIYYSIFIVYTCSNKGN